MCSLIKSKALPYSLFAARITIFENFDDAVKNGIVLTADGKFVVNTADSVMMQYVLPVLKVVMGYPMHLLHSDKG